MVHLGIARPHNPISTQQQQLCCIGRFHFGFGSNRLPIPRSPNPLNSCYLRSISMDCVGRIGRQRGRETSKCPVQSCSGGGRGRECGSCTSPLNGHSTQSCCCIYLRPGTGFRKFTMVQGMQEMIHIRCTRNPPKIRDSLFYSNSRFRRGPDHRGLTRIHTVI